MQEHCENTNLKEKDLVFYRSTILYFKEDPYIYSEDVQLGRACNYYEDGLLVINIKTGLIVSSGNYPEQLQIYQKMIPEIEKKIDLTYQHKLIMPGMVDCHTHYPQTEMLCANTSGLMHWLNTYTFPVEGQFGDITYARKIAKFYINELLKHGTTSALVFASVHKESVTALFDEALDKNMRVLCGKTLMDKNAPDYLTDTPDQAWKESCELIEQYDNKGRLGYSITPRFAITSSSEQLKVVGKLKEKYPETWIHTHLNENLQEIQLVKELFPESDTYLGVYKDHGMLSKKSVFAHCVHNTKEEFEAFKDVQCGVAFCPSSNGFMGAGIFDYHKSVKNGMNFGLGTDVGGGTDFSLLKTLQDAYKFIMLSQSQTDKRRPMTVLEGFYRATLGGAKALSLEDKIGKLDTGYEADFVVFEWHTNDIQRIRTEGFSRAEMQNTDKDEFCHLEYFKQKLFGLLMMGDQQNVYATHIAGVQRFCKQINESTPHFNNNNK